MKGIKFMDVGYVRLSRDDDKRNYVSIENQKLIIEQYAASQNKTINRWYEDDGFSGYLFNRPGFNQLMKDLDKDVDTVIAKDFSRIGRHNARVLLLLEEFLERGKRLIIIDDNYDSLEPDDDIIGIKTWYNERYVKDTSKKIKRVIGARQKEGTWLVRVPFGYIRTEEDKNKIVIVPQEAETVKNVYCWYLQGFGYRKIANHLKEQGLPTPSMLWREQEIAKGKISKRQISYAWSDGMIKDMLANDFYSGIYRLHKRARATINGKDKRVPKEEQWVFENHHPSIIDKVTFDLVQEVKEKRIKSNYRGSKGKWEETEISNPFGGFLFCKDCKSRLTPIVRKTTNGIRKYYICSTYNTKGKRYCSKAHLIEEKDLMKDVIAYVQLCRSSLYHIITAIDMNDFDTEWKTEEDKQTCLKKLMMEQKKQLKTLFYQKLKDLSANLDHSDLIYESYESIEIDLLDRIHTLELQLNELSKNKGKIPEDKRKRKTALGVIDSIIEKGTLDRQDIEVLVDHITVNENGFPDVKLRYDLSEFIHCSPAPILNKGENEIIFSVMKLISEDDRGYTSAKYLSAKLTEMGDKKSNKSVLPYINLMIENGILEPTDNPLKPYTIVKTSWEINECNMFRPVSLGIFTKNTCENTSQNSGCE